MWRKHDIKEPDTYTHEKHQRQCNIRSNAISILWWRWTTLARTRKQERAKLENTRPLRREAYSHPNDPNLQIYPERRDQSQWTEQIEMFRFDPSPRTKAQKNRERERETSTKRTTINKEKETRPKQQHNKTRKTKQDTKNKQGTITS